MDRIVSLLSRYRAESPILSPNTGKYGLEKARISSFFTQCSTLYVAVALTSSFCTHIWQVIYKRSNPAASQFITVSFHFLFLPTPLARIPTIKIFTQRLWSLWRLKDWSEDMLFESPLVGGMFSITEKQNPSCLVYFFLLQVFEYNLPKKTRVVRIHFANFVRCCNRRRFFLNQGVISSMDVHVSKNLFSLTAVQNLWKVSIPY